MEYTTSYGSWLGERFMQRACLWDLANLGEVAGAITMSGAATSQTRYCCTSPIVSNSLSFFSVGRL